MLADAAAAEAVAEDAAVVAAADEVAAEAVAEDAAVVAAADEATDEAVAEAAATVSAASITLAEGADPPLLADAADLRADR